ncbi:Exo70 domain-containing protein [Cephalotus follicularis]|uniref:Exocyst subunit Exo70 family protein n=1 Tax=Cephalotus follicularis TaxID=3775 RepID=A0A1Q3B9E1_CEPFO|nr:Exo70 domain-containing protein [Cephalotus follicularis]
MQEITGEQHVFAAARHIMKALGATKNLSEDLRKILKDLDSHLSTMTTVTEGKGGGLIEIEQRLKYAERKVLSWELNQSMIWDSGPREASEFLGAVNEVETLTKSLRGSSMNANRKQKEIFNRAESILQMAMSRLEEELIHILVQHKQYLEPECMSFRSYGEDVVYDESFVSLDDQSVEDASHRNSSGNHSEVYIVDLVHPHIIPDVNAIANAMFASNYGHEFCLAFIGVRKDALDEYLVVLEMEKLSIEDVMKMEWISFNNEIRKWVQAVKIIIKVYLSSEKEFCDKILGNFSSVNLYCFVEISKASMLCLLNFGEAISMGPIRPEKLFRLLDMYEVLAELLLNVNELYSGETGSFIRNEFQKLLWRLGDTAKATFLEFQNAIASNESLCPFPKGGIHHLTRYVMNYVKTLTEYVDTLNVLLKDLDAADDSNLVIEPENGQNIPSIFCPMACHLRSITCTLESNLKKKGKLYKDYSLQHIFMMNNVHYMVQKVKGSKLRLFFGDEWIRKHIGKYQQHATSYERATWSSVLSLLRDDGNSSPISKATVKERCRGFSTAFEEVYKIQTQWSIPDLHLREDLRIANSLKVIHAYRTFIGRISAHISDKYIKYSVADLENFLLDFFEGSPKSLRNSCRR